MKGLYLVAIIICLATLFSCRKKNEVLTDYEQQGLSDTLVTRLYKLGTDGHYEEYVSNMASCDNTTPEYKEQVKLALKQHNANITKSKNGVANVEFLRATFHDNNHMANCYLNVTFKDGSVEEILFPLVKVNDSWKIQ